jgi:tRNA A37 methylthiotransferase MiaB
MRIAIYTLGCKLNQAEADELEKNLRNEGFFVVGRKNKKRSLSVAQQGH